MAQQVELHRRYGPIVRIGPNEISFTCAEAWKEIYGMRRDQGGEMPKCTVVDTPLFGIRSILTTEGTAEHGYLRRMIAPAFTDRAVKEQESLVQKQIDLLMQRLKAQADGSTPIDMCKWITFTVFDVIGDLTWGESFHCLETSTYHTWLTSIMANIQIIACVSVGLRFPYIPVALLVLMASPKTILISREHIRSVKDKVCKRLARLTDAARPDFMSHISKKTEANEGLSLLEMQTMSHVFVIAGSETSATALSGAVYHLLRFPQRLRRLQDEIRTSFARDDEITYEAVVKLPYLAAVVQETLRIYPPVPGILQRIVPREGTFIAGQYIPGGTVIGVHHYASYHSPSNFRDPELFVPERWLNDSSSLYADERQLYVEDQRDVLQPFSVGPRDCIGRRLAYMEIKLILARLVWGLDWELDDGNAGDWVVKQRVFNLWEKSPLNVVCKKAHAQ